jgi:hypothetical protein
MSIHDNGGSPRSATTPNPDSLPDIGLRRRRGVRVTTAAAVALGLAIGGGAVASAATSGSSTSTSTPGTHAESQGGQEGRSGHDGFGGTPPAAMGTVASVGASTFTLTTRDNTTVTVEVGSSTTYLDHDVTSPSLADIKVGTRVAVFGTDTANTVTATKVGIGTPPSGGDGPGHGPGPGDGDGDGGMGAPMSGSATGSTTSTSTNGPAVNA